MSNNKIIFSGPPGVGITTAIKTISDIDPVTKKEKVKDDTGKEITVEMDYGILKLDSGEQIYLYGVHDKDKLKCTHDTFSKDCIGLILLINNTDADPVGTMLGYIEDCRSLVEKKGIAVGTTRCKDSPSPSINEFHITLREKKLNIPFLPIFSVNCHEKADIITIIRALLYNLDSGVN